MKDLLFWANLLGYIGLLMLWIQVVFGSRHIFKHLTTDNVLMSRIHKQIGIWGMLFVLSHPLLMMMNRLEDMSWLFVPNFFTETETHITFGRFALILFIVVWFTSAMIREKIKWRPWKYMHLLSYPILFFTLIHIPEIGSWYEESVAFRILWSVVFFSFVASILLRLTYWAGFNKNKFNLISKDFLGQDLLFIKVKLENPNNKNQIISNIGQHFYLQTNRFKSEHPFTVISNVDGVLTFGIRRVGGFWEEIVSKDINEPIYVDGPYGTFTKEAWNDEEKVVISAGIGVTPFVDLVANFGSSILYMNCSRNIEEAYERELLLNKSKAYIDILNSNNQIINEEIVSNFLKANTQKNLSDLKYFICGSPNFIKAIKQIMSNLGVSSKQIYFEELGF